MRFFDFSKELVKSSVQMGEIAENWSATLLVRERWAFRWLTVNASLNIFSAEPVFTRAKRRVGVRMARADRQHFTDDLC